MTRLKHLLKVDIVARDAGLNIGRPSDILVDPETHRAALMVLSYGKVPETSVVFPASAVASFSGDALTIPDLATLHLALRDDLSMSQLQRGIRIRGRTVFTAAGKHLGSVAAIEVDGEGKVVEYRIRQPRLGLLRPTLPLKPADVGALGENVVVTRSYGPPATPGKAAAGVGKHGTA